MLFRLSILFTSPYHTVWTSFQSFHLYPFDPGISRPAKKCSLEWCALVSHSVCCNLEELQPAAFRNSNPHWQTVGPLSRIVISLITTRWGQTYSFLYKRKIGFILKNYVRLHLPLYHQNSFTYCIIFGQIFSNTSSILEPQLQKQTNK